MRYSTGEAYPGYSTGEAYPGYSTGEVYPGIYTTLLPGIYTTSPVPPWVYHPGYTMHTAGLPLSWAYCSTDVQGGGKRPWAQRRLFSWIGSLPAPQEPKSVNVVILPCAELLRLREEKDGKIG